MSTKKYRPYLTLPELTIISSALRLVSDPPTILIRYIDRYIDDIKQDVRKENHKLAPSLADKLEFTDAVQEVLESPEQLQFLMSQHKAHGFVGMASSQIKVLQSHRYTQGLMTPEEEKEYEKTQGL